MKSGSPAFGTLEHVKMTIASGQLARHIGLPWRPAAGVASNTADMQAASETHMGLWAAMLANATLTVYAAGWQEGGLTFGYEKFINDIETLQTLAELCSAVPQAEDELAWSALADVAQGEHFFATRHTMQRYREAFYRPLVADLANFGAWENAGARTSAERATGIWKTTLENFRAPARGELAAERIAGYIKKHERAGGAPPTGG